MNSGSFFQLDLNTSKVEEGVTFFEYTDLPDFDAAEDTIRYPVRLTISQDSVTIISHYCVNDGKKEFLPRHSEEVILDLPYRSAGTDTLSSIIKNVYNTVFPFSDYLRNLISDRYINPKDAYKDLQDSQVNRDTYSSLFIWGLIRVAKDDKLEYQIHDPKSNEVTGFLRKLLLDFMFDLMHSNIFECSKYYSQMRSGLMNDFFFSSIVKKSEYYYYRRLVRNRFQPIIHSWTDPHSITRYFSALRKIVNKRRRRNSLPQWLLSFGIKVAESHPKVKDWKLLQSLKDELTKRIEIVSQGFTRNVKLLNENKALKRVSAIVESIREKNGYDSLNYYPGLVDRFRNPATENGSPADDVFKSLKDGLYNVPWENYKDDYSCLEEVVSKIRKCERRRRIRARFPEFVISLTSHLEDLLPAKLKDWLIDKCTKRINSIDNKRADDLDKIEKDENFHPACDTIKLVKDLFVSRLDESESEWIDVITSPQADKHFSFIPEWFEDKDKQKKNKDFNVSDSWFVNPEEEMNRLVFPLIDAKETNNKHYLNSFELSNLIGTKDNASVRARNSKVSKWYYHRFDFDGAFRIHCFKGWNQFFAFLMLCLFAVTSLSSIIPIPCFWECPRNIALLPFCTSAYFFLASILYLINSSYKSFDGIDDALVKIRRRRECWRSLRLSLLFFAIWLFLYYFNSRTSHWVSMYVLLGVVLVILRIPPRFYIIDNIHLFLPRLVASITAAWIVIVIGNDLFKENLSVPIWCILSVIVFLFILYESHKVLPNVSNSERIWRTLELMLISYSISLIIGIFAIDILTPETAVSSVNWGAEPFTITIYPDYLIPFSFLAMFIGVFIQMIFEEKNITEM